jgi:hypothetical protein
MTEHNESQTVTREELCEELEQLVLEKEEAEDYLISLEYEAQPSTNNAE